MSECSDYCKAFNLNDRLQRLEDRYESFTKCQHPRLLQERIDNLENAGKRPAPWALESDVNELRKHHNLLSQAVAILQSEVKQLNGQKYNKTPHKCPVCEGFKIRPNRKYNDPDIMRYVDCDACEGKGLVWG